MESLLCLLLLCACVAVSVSSPRTVQPSELQTKSDRNATMQAEAPISDCYCVSSGIPLQPYEQFVAATSGAGCIGGCGGGDFVIHSPNQFVQTFTAWVGCGSPNNGIRGFQIFYPDGSSYFEGTACGTSQSFTFQPGESLVGNLILCGNGIGTRLGYIEFKTNKGRTFSIGDSHTLYLFPADGLFLTGAFGGAGSDVDRFGFIFSKRITSSALIDVDYPTLGTITSGLTPKTVFSKNYTNKSPLDQHFSAQFQADTGEDTCWTVDIGVSFGGEYSVTGGVPEVAETSAGFHWEVSASAQHQSCSHHTETKTFDYPFDIPAYSQCTAKITQFDSALSQLPFTANLQLSFQDSGTYSFPLKGNYQGVYVSVVTQNFTCTDLPHTPDPDPDAACSCQKNKCSGSCPNRNEHCVKTSDCTGRGEL